MLPFILYVVICIYTPPKFSIQKDQVLVPYIDASRAVPASANAGPDCDACGGPLKFIVQTKKKKKKKKD
jgi:hypothetical protein